MPIRKILAYILATIALVFEGFFGIVPFMQFAIQIVVIACALYLLVSLFRRKNMPVWRTTIISYITTILATIGFFTSIFLVFISYHNFVPGIISDITLTNSGQEIVFVQMSHIATPEFYREKQATISSLASSGYTILFEGVKPGTLENQEKFNQSIGFNFTPTLYSSISDLIGLESQNNKILFAGISTGSLISVDISIDDIVKFMGTGSIITGTGSIGDVESDILQFIPGMNYQEKLFISWMARGFLNWSLKQSEDINMIIASSDQSNLFETIIDRRNDQIVEYIIAHPKEKIAVVYGALHFNGVYETLQKRDKNWNTIDIKNSTPYSK